MVDIGTANVSLQSRQAWQMAEKAMGYMEANGTYLLVPIWMPTQTRI